MTEVNVVYRTTVRSPSSRNWETHLGGLERDEPAAHSRPAFTAAQVAAVPTPRRRAVGAVMTAYTPEMPPVRMAIDVPTGTSSNEAMKRATSGSAANDDGKSSVAASAGIPLAAMTASHCSSNGLCTRSIVMFAGGGGGSGGGATPSRAEPRGPGTALSRGPARSAPRWRCHQRSREGTAALDRTSSRWPTTSPADTSRARQPLKSGMGTPVTNATAVSNSRTSPLALWRANLQYEPTQFRLAAVTNSDALATYRG